MAHKNEKMGSHYRAVRSGVKLRSDPYATRAYELGRPVRGSEAIIETVKADEALSNDARFYQSENRLIVPVKGVPPALRYNLPALHSLLTIMRAADLPFMIEARKFTVTGKNNDFVTLKVNSHIGEIYRYDHQSVVDALHQAGTKGTPANYLKQHISVGQFATSKVAHKAAQVMNDTLHELAYDNYGEFMLENPQPYELPAIVS